MQKTENSKKGFFFSDWNEEKKMVDNADMLQLCGVIHKQSCT
jgi:hypothetical protein